MESVATDHAIHILCTLDDTYVTYAGVMLSSLLHNLGKADTVIHVISPDLSAAGMAQLSQLAELYHCKFHFIHPSDQGVANLPQSIKRWPMSSYLRLIAAEVLPRELRRVIYIDCDIIVDTSIRPLWDLDLQGNALAAVCDAPQGEMTIDHVKSLGLKGEYFNSGVMVMDLEKFRTLDIPQRSLNLLCGDASCLEFPDQDILNILLDNECLYLPAIWNIQSAHLKRTGSTSPDIAKTSHDIRCGKAHGIIHYTGVYKPWLNDLNDFHPLEHIWRRYHKMSPWADVPLSLTDRSLRRRLARLRHAFAFRHGWPSAFDSRWNYEKP